MLAQITLSSTESKRLIAKAVVEHNKVKRALKDGIVAIGLGSTNAYIAEELLGESLDKSRYIAGYLDEKGSCVLPSKLRLKEVVLEKGRLVDASVGDIISKMHSGDVIIKGANAIDRDGTAGVMLASDVGGTIAKVYGIAKARGVDIIVPAGIEKSVLWSISELSKKMGIEKVRLSTGVPVGIFPVAGEIITEEKAFDILFGVRAYAISAGSLGRAHAVTFILEGEESSVTEAFDFVRNIKGEPPLRVPPRNCKACEFRICPNNINFG